MAMVTLVKKLHSRILRPFWFPTAMEQLAYLALMLFLGPLAQVGLHPERQSFL